jgi:3-oxoacyl-(acyl-carrier-protein) synthase
MKKLWVTGTGACGAAGNTWKQVWERLLAGDTSAARRFEQNFTIYPAVAFDGGLLSPKEIRRMDRVALLGCVAVREAMQATRILPTSGEAHLEEAGMVVGTGRGPIATLSEMFMRTARGASTFPTQVATASMSSVVGHLANHAGVGGMCFVVSTACTSGATAIVTAAGLMHGPHRMMIAGGTDAPLDPAFVRQFSATGVLAQGPSPTEVLRPFQRDRCGTALGELSLIHI